MKKLIKKFVKKLGYDLVRITPTTNNALRTKLLLDHHKIDVVLDVGANIGQYASGLREYGYAGKIVSFEPLTKAHAELLKVSHDDNLWTVADRMAIGDFDGEIEINIAGNSYSSSVLEILDLHVNSAPNSAYVDKEHSIIRRLDTIATTFMDNTSSIYLKIDVQGFEKQVIDGALALLPNISGLQLELSLAPLYEGQILHKQMIEYIEQLGFEIYAIYPGFSDRYTGRMLQMDGVFFKKQINK